MLPTVTFHDAPSTVRSAHVGSTNGVGAAVVVALEGMGVVRLVSGSGDDEMAAVELVLDVCNRDVLPPPHTQHARRAVPFDPTASAKSVPHKSSVANATQSYAMLPTVTFHDAPSTVRSAHEGSTNGVGAAVVVALEGMGVVKLVSGSGDDEMAAVELVLEDGANKDVLPPPHTQHAIDAVVSLDPTAFPKSVLHS